VKYFIVHHYTYKYEIQLDCIRFLRIQLVTVYNMYLRRRHLSGKSWHSDLRELTISVSVSLSGGCNAHVSGTGPDIYPLTSLQSISSLAVANDSRRTIQHDKNQLWKRSRLLVIVVAIHAFLGRGREKQNATCKLIRAGYDAMTRNWQSLTFWREILAASYYRIFVASTWHRL